MIRAENLNKTYDRYRRNANHVLKDVSFELPDTGFVCILGPSGCGKTSLLNAIGGLDRFDSGVLSSGDVSVSRYGTYRYEAERNRSYGYIFQNYYLLSEHSVAYNIYLGLHSLDLSHKEKLLRIRQALEAVDMSRYIRRKVGELSGGQQQRVAIARALARRPRVIFADEPTGNLDEANTMNICTLLRQISKTSLVVMVTHEERIAEFFADRIIRLDNGRISSDSKSWERSSLDMGADKDLYAGDYREESFSSEGVELRVLQEEGAEPLSVTVVALKDRIVIKLNDGRAVTCGAPEDFPALKEGCRPTMTLETVDRREEHALAAAEAVSPQTAAGRGIGLWMMLKEAASLVRGAGAKRISMRIFLMLLAVLTVWTTCDYLTVSSADPRDFVTSDSHVIQLTLERGSGAGGAYPSMEKLFWAYNDYLDQSPEELTFLPLPNSSISYSSKLFYQMGSVEVYMKEYSYAPLDKLDPDQLILGRMPEKYGEIVVDTWALEKLVENDSIVKNVITDVSVFLGEKLYFDRADLYLTVVGICDSGEPSLYIGLTDLYRTTKTAASVMSLSDFKAAHPGEFDELTLTEGECVVNSYAAGPYFEGQEGTHYYFDQYTTFVIKQVVNTGDFARIVVADSVLEQFITDLCDSGRYYLYCADKEAVKELIAQPLPEHLKDMLTIKVRDAHAEAWAEYREASNLRVDARTIVTVTVMVLSMVMLYLLCRSQAQERIGMMAVYRLLGIPGRKLAGIFAMESVMASAQTALPMTALTWFVLNVLTSVESWGIRLILPWYAALAVYAGILAYHLIVSMLPLLSLLKMPPAQLAAKYDY